MRGRILLLAALAALHVLGCQPSGSAGDRCRTSDAFARTGRAFNNKQSAAADATENLQCELADMRDDANAREKRAEARTRKADDDQERRARDEGNRQIDAELAGIRRSPKVPDLGATLAEGRVLCSQQRGEFVNRSSSFGCRVRKQVIFACTLDDESRADRCDGYYEDADFPAARKAIEAKLGPANKEYLSTASIRVFEWANNSETVIVTMYAKGVRMTHARRAADGELPDP